LHHLKFLLLGSFPVVLFPVLCPEGQVGSGPSLVSRIARNLSERDDSMKILRCFLLSFTSLLFSVGLSFAQITNVTDVEATSIPGAGHDYLHMLDETVNPANGSLSVRIQGPVPKGRGLTLPFSFAYDSNGAIPGPTAINQSPAGPYPYLSKAGWSYSAPMITATTTKLQGLFEGDKIYCSVSTGYVFYDAQGTRHALDNLAEVPTNQSCTEMGLFTSPTGGDAWISAQEASLANVLTIQDADGTTYSFPPGTNWISGVNQGSMTSLVSSVEDRNGNVIKYVDNGGGAVTVTDTAGRTVISSNGFGATGNTVTVSGLANPYSLNWGATATWNYNAGVDLVDITPNGSCDTPPPVNPTAALRF